MKSGTLTIDELRNALEVSASSAAPLLIGATIESHIDGFVRAIITEVEAYEQDDPASHTFRGPSQRNRAMFGPAGHAYIYLTYGMHYCFNVTAGPENEGHGILVRAIDIVDGQELAIKRRYPLVKPTVAQLKNLSNGPGKVVQALDVTMDHYGVDLFDTSSPIRITACYPTDSTATPRIGISKNKEALWRWVI